MFPSTLFLPFSMIAALETGNLTVADTVDTQNGILVHKNMTVTDANFSTGGYGKMLVKDILGLSSYVGTVLAVQKAFPDSSRFIDQLEKMSVLDLPRGVKKTNIQLIPQAIGVELPSTPLKILTAYNAIANDGEMTAPGFTTGDKTIINPKICSDKTITTVQQLLFSRVNQFMSSQGIDNLHQFAGSKQGQGKIVMGTTSETFCGYFPYNEPKYTCMLVLYRKEADLKSKKILLILANQLATLCETNQIN